MKPRRHAAALALFLALTPTVSGAQEARVRRFAELTAAEVAKLDRAHTVVIVPGAIIEEHGPYLPVYADGYRNDRLALDLANGITRARPRWRAVILPTIPLGAGAFNIVAGRPAFPGSVGVRAATVRDVFMDVADALGAQGFRYVFVVHGHGDPNHNRALDLAGEYFHDTYGGVMVHLLGRAGCQPESMGPNSGPPATLFDSAAAASDADSPHAGAVESARTMYLRPDLVPANISHAPDVSAPSPADWRRVGTDSAWTGYVGAPRHASVALGRWEYAHERAACTNLALELLDGRDERTIARYADRMRAIPPLRATLDSILAMDDSAAARQSAWLRHAATDTPSHAADEREIMARSHAVFDAEHTGDRAALDALLATDYRYLSSIGNSERPKPQEIEEQLGMRVESYSVGHPRIAWLSPEAVALEYVAHQRLRRLGDGRVICPYSGAMEGWARRDGQWKMVTRTEWLIGAVRAQACADSTDTGSHHN